MTHDWIKALDLQVSSYMDDALAESLTNTAIQGFAVDATVSFKAPAAPRVVEDLFEAQRMIDEVIHAEHERQEEILRAAIENHRPGEGMLVVQEDGRVVSCESSPLVPENTAYVIDNKVLQVAPMDPSIWRRYGPIID